MHSDHGSRRKLSYTFSFEDDCKKRVYLCEGKDAVADDHFRCRIKNRRGKIFFFHLLPFALPRINPATLLVCDSGSHERPGGRHVTPLENYMTKPIRILSERFMSPQCCLLYCLVSTVNRP